MNTRFSSLVTLKKNAMQKSERALQDANRDLKSAQNALDISYSELNTIESPQSGTVSQFLASKQLIDSQRAMIQHNQEWIDYASTQVESAKEQLQNDTIEYEKFKYLELQEMKKILKQRKLQEAKALDEVALMTFKREMRG